MPRFLAKTAVLAALLGLVLLGALFGLDNPAARATILGALIDKHARLQEPGTNRVILVGGSNLPMALSCRPLADRLHRPVLDTGVHAGLGLRFMLADMVRFARPGDVFVVCPEYEQFFTDLWLGDMELLCVVFDVAPETRRLISTRQWLALSECMGPYAADKICNACLQLLSRGTHADMLRGYGRSDLDEWGDERSLPEKSPGAIPVPKRTGREQVNAAVVRELLNFGDTLQVRGARVVMMPPICQASAFDAHSNVIFRIEAALRQAGMPFAAPPSRYRLPDNLFNDTAYHAVREGGLLRTRLLCDDLAAVLGAGPPVAGASPETTSAPPPAKGENRRP